VSGTVEILSAFHVFVVLLQDPDPWSGASSEATDDAVVA
jgi:hypothetical protein